MPGTSRSSNFPAPNTSASGAGKGTRATLRQATPTEKPAPAEETAHASKAIAEVTPPEQPPAPQQPEQSPAPQQPEPEKSEPAPEGQRTIHFVRDGVTIPGRQFKAGQEYTFDPETVAYKRSRNRKGKSVLDLDEDAQRARWGNVYFKNGPAPKSGE